MGGYGTFVWPAFMAAALIIGAMTLFSLRSLRQARRALSRLQDET